MNQPPKQPSLILGLLITIAAAAASLGCPGDPVPVDTNVDVLDLLTSSITVDSTFVTDTITGPSLTATAADGHNIIMDVAWTSSNPAVLRLVSTPTSKTGYAVADRFDGGVFAAISEGDAIITATPTGNIKTVGGKSVVYRELISVAGPPATIKISPSSPPILQVSQDGVTNANASFVAKAIVRSTSGRAIARGLTVRWTLLDLGPAMFWAYSPVVLNSVLTSDPIVYQLFYGPEIRGIKAGTVRLVASLEPRAGHTLPTLSDLVTFSVGGGSAVITGETIAPLEVGDSRVFSVSVRDRADNPVANPVVRWSTSRASTASVDQNGKVTAVGSAAAGDTVSVLAFIPSLGITGRATFAVYGKVASMTFDPNPVNIPLGGALRGYLHLADAAGRPITRYAGETVWSLVADGATYASLGGELEFVVDTTRLITAVALGDATMKVVLKAITLSVPIHIIPKPAALIVLAVPSGGGFRPPVATGEPLRVGVSLLLTATAKTDDGLVLVEPLQFSSAQPSIIRLTAASSNTATITGLAPGTATITVTSSSKPSVTATMSVLVTAAPTGGAATSIVVSSIPETGITTVGGTVQFRAVAKDASGATASGCNVTMATDRSSIASISSTGLATGVGIGATAVRAFCIEGGAVNASAKLTVVDATFGVTQVNVTPRFVRFPASTLVTSFPFSASVTQTAPGAAAPVAWTIAQFPAGIISIDPATGLVSVPASTGSTFGGGGIITATAAGQTDIGWVTYGNAGTIRGQMISASGQYLGGASAIATPTTGGASVTTTINNDGFFYLIGLPAGSYTVTVSQQGNPAQQTFFGVVATAGSQTVLTLLPFL